MGDFGKHMELAKEKLASLTEAYAKGRNTVVGDLATKVVEQLVEADAARSDMHFGGHKERHEYSNANFPEGINKSTQKIWFAYGDLGYDGTNGKRAAAVMADMNTIVQFFEERFDEKIAET